MNLVEAVKRNAQKRAIDGAVTLKASEFLAWLDEDAGSVLVRPLTVGEQEDASAAALRFRKNALESLGEKARELIDDPRMLEDAEYVERAWRAARDAADPSKPAFPSADFIRENMTAEEVAVLSATLETVQRRSSPIAPMGKEEREDFAELLASLNANSEADRLVAAMPRTHLADLLIWACKAWTLAKNAQASEQHRASDAL